MQLQGKVVFITGASRGIGKAIALRLAAEEASIAVLGKSVEENPKLGGTIYSASAEIEAAGGKALPIPCDVRDEEQIINAVNKTIETWGGIDVLINNASAISLTNTEQTETKRFDLMHDINVRGTYIVTKHCIPHLKKANNAHIITLSPPVNMNMQWFKHHIAYTLSKYNMSMMALGWAAELTAYKIASNALWPATTIATAAVKNLLGGDMLIARSRKPDIVADAVWHIIQQPHTYTGQTLIDEDVLRSAGITDFSQYAVTPGSPLQKDLFLD
ncbi:short chain dehydrogenase [Chitinophagaceae bacterium IBVUCB1]|nr:short chain dehydrogenase [Chitinophagaceae bacterium IBVUCB1]